MQQNAVLIIDDDPSMVTWLRRVVSARGFDPIVAQNASQGLERLAGDDALRARLTEGALAHARTLTWSATSTELMRIIAAEVSRRRTRR